MAVVLSERTHSILARLLRPVFLCLSVVGMSILDVTYLMFVEPFFFWGVQTYRQLLHYRCYRCYLLARTTTCSQLYSKSSTSPSTPPYHKRCAHSCMHAYKYARSTQQVRTYQDVTIHPLKRKCRQKDHQSIHVHSDRDASMSA